MKFVQVSLDKLLLGMRDDYLARRPAGGTRFAPLGFAPMVLSGEAPARHRGDGGSAR
ncbi:hypothetical protein NYR54_02260 [Chelativorans sp. SCAU2101]|jgi:hypothetical protein|uniref:Uncharacterized protein n=1 Tax=Chelativorans petroleitrophicus TaxID=2975484 RepID=A0A9X3B5R3_9HYPH|nr:hypothetical protein [Chelativorans petroleitrophicus]MCT8989122.1 hypothetical protein [Chelativorans petroleitrophicus]